MRIATESFFHPEVGSPSSLLLDLAVALQSNQGKRSVRLIYCTQIREFEAIDDSIPNRVKIFHHDKHAKPRHPCPRRSALSSFSARLCARTYYRSRGHPENSEALCPCAAVQYCGHHQGCRPQHTRHWHRHHLSRYD